MGWALLHKMEELRATIAARNIDGLHKGWTELHWACLLSSPECVSFLVDSGADINARTKAGSTPLMLASDSSLVGSYDCAKILLKSGADVNIASNSGWTALHAACSKLGYPCDQCDELIELLIASGADVNARTCEGTTPLYLACMKNELSVVQFLLEAGADPSIKNNEGRLPQDTTMNKDIIELIESVSGGFLTKEAQHYK